MFPVFAFLDVYAGLRLTHRKCYLVPVGQPWSDDLKERIYISALPLMPPTCPRTICRTGARAWLPPQTKSILE